MRYDVALAACKSYEDAEVSAALETAVTACLLYTSDAADD